VQERGKTTTMERYLSKSPFKSVKIAYLKLDIGNRRRLRQRQLLQCRVSPDSVPHIHYRLDVYGSDLVC